MELPSKSRTRMARYLLNHRWLLLSLLGLSALAFEVFGHRGAENAVDAHFVHEVLFFSIVYPLVVGLLLNLLLKAQEERNLALRRQNYEKRLQ